MLQINDSLYICSGHFYPNRYNLYNVNKNTFEPFGSYPYFDDLNLPKDKSLWFLTFQSRFCCVDNNYFVSATDLTPSISFFKLDKGKVVMLKDINIEKPQVVPQNRGGQIFVSKKDTNKMGFRDVCAAKGYVFALYSGRSYNEFKGKTNYCNTILVYTKEGDAVANLKIDKEILKICIMGNTIIGMTDDPDITMYRFPIPKELL